MGITYLYIIAEDVVESDLQAWDTRQFDLTLLYLQQIILAGISDGTQVIQFLVDTLRYNSSLIDQRRGIVINLFLNSVADQSASI